MKRFLVDNLDVLVMSVAGMLMGLHWWQMLLLAVAVGVGSGLTSSIKQRLDDHLQTT